MNQQNSCALNLKDFKDTPIGRLPVDWGIARLDEIAIPLTETAGQKKYETVSISAGIGFVNQAEKFGKELSGKQYEKYIVLHRGDFSYNKGNSNRYPQGCIYRLNDREVAAVPNVFESFRIVKGYPEYYEQLFISGFLNHQLYRLINHGVRDDGLLNLTDKDFYSCMLPVPPQKEQKKIAEILSLSDMIIDKHRQLLVQLGLQKKCLVRNLFPKQSNSTPVLRFPGFSSAWEQRKLSDITSKIGSGKTPCGGNGTYCKSGIPLIRSQNVNNDCVDLSDVVFIDELTDASMESSRVFTNDILLNITGASLGRSAVYKEKPAANVNQHVCIIRVNDNYLPTFIQQQLASGNGQRQIELNQAGGGREGLNFQQIGLLQFMFPSLAEQQQIGDVFDHLNKLITLHQRKFEEEKKKKNALIQLLLTGIVRVST